MLTFFGSVADYAAGDVSEDGERIAAVAVAMARLAGLPSDVTDALYFAARLRNVGVLGNAALAKGVELSERERTMELWDIPPIGARICERMHVLPPGTVDVVRWQRECWDGTGIPDQLRWGGIPKAAQLLHIAIVFARATEPEEALATIGAESGRSFSPEHTRTFVQWFHLNGGEPESAEAPYGSLSSSVDVGDVLAILSELVDAHNGTPGRATRIESLVEAIGNAMKEDAADVCKARTAARLFGIGELRSAQVETQQFDALARLGIETRAAHASIAADLVERCPSLSEIAPVLRARGEWYDGSGAPASSSGDAIPRASQILAAAIAFDAIDDTSRLQTVSGSLFDPSVVRAIADVAKTRR